MTRPEIFGERSLAFSGWIHEHLPDSCTGFCVANLDWLFWNYKTRRLLLAEEKMHGAELRTWFARFMYEVMDPALKLYAPQNHIDYRGFHKIIFENTSPDDGKIYLDGKEISADDLRTFLAMETSIKP